MVLKALALSDDLHPGLHTINSPPPPYSEWDGSNDAESLGSTVDRQSIKRDIDTSSWLADNIREPLIGNPDCPLLRYRAQ